MIERCAEYGHCACRDRAFYAKTPLPARAARLCDGAIVQSAFGFSRIKKQLSLFTLSHFLNASRHLLSFYLTNDASKKSATFGVTL